MEPEGNGARRPLHRRARRIARTPGRILAPRREGRHDHRWRRGRFHAAERVAHAARFGRIRPADIQGTALLGARAQWWPHCRVYVALMRASSTVLRMRSPRRNFRLRGERSTAGTNRRRKRSYDSSAGPVPRGPSPAAASGGAAPPVSGSLLTGHVRLSRYDHNGGLHQVCNRMRNRCGSIPRVAGIAANAYREFVFRDGGGNSRAWTRSTPIRSRARRTARTHSPKTNPPAPSTDRPNDSRIHRNSHGSPQSHPPPVTRPRPRSRHVLPLRFAQQPVLLPCLPRQPFHIRLRIFPTHVNHRTTASAPTCIVRTMPATSAPRYARIPLPKRHLVHPHRKRPPYPHTMHRSFIVISAILRRRRTHLVRPRRHHHQLRTLRAIPELRPKRSCHRPALPQPQQLLHTVRVWVGWGPGARGIGEHPRKHPAPPPGSTAASRARQGQRHRRPARRRGHQGPPRQERIVTRNCASPGRP